MLGVPTEQTTDLWIVLHGYGQLAATFAESAEWPLAPHRVYLFPEALQRFYDASPGSTHADAPVGANWMTRDAREDDIADNIAYLDAVLHTARADAAHAAHTVFGFSQGAATAARWAEVLVRRGTPPARLVVWGGVLPPDVDLGPDAPLRRIPVHVVIGIRDRWATPARVESERARLAAASFPITLLEFAGGHRLDDGMLRTLVG
jgi:predicted esterase